MLCRDVERLPHPRFPRVAWTCLEAAAGLRAFLIFIVLQQQFAALNKYQAHLAGLFARKTAAYQILRNLCCRGRYPMPVDIDNKRVVNAFQ